MIFPPSFFDSMEHLPVHLPFEVKVGGPVQYRWMYPYRVAPSIDLEENSNFRVFNDSLVDVDAEELNVVLSSTSVQKNIAKEDDNEIEECDETDDNNSIENEDENSD